jgi:hypothetical protein
LGDFSLEFIWSPFQLSMYRLKRRIFFLILLDLRNIRVLFYDKVFFGQLPLVPLLLLGPQFFPIILFLSTTLSTGMTSISLHMQWPLTSQLHRSILNENNCLLFSLRIKLHAQFPSCKYYFRKFHCITLPSYSTVSP